ncbi:hypothetical protein [Inquilinus sp.]|jgi:hypothetical protein|uniref:hypothetical protein n=1 Tax=Inquilinus sp. TaxID=1932117 RepID=UPI00378306A6
MASESSRDFLKMAGGNAAGGQAMLRLAQGRRYRFAGCLEDGTPSVFDPAFGQPGAA